MSSHKSTIIDIAKELNISASTVSRALKDHPRISKATKENVLELAKELNYRPNSIATALKSGKSRLIGIIVPIIDRAFFSSVIRGVEEVANKLGYRVMVSQSYEKLENEIGNLDAFIDARVDGVIASIGKGTKNFDHYKNLINKGTPLVLFDRTTDELKTNQVVIDDFKGAYKATEHLIEQGRKHIVHFTYKDEINIYKERYRGYRKALKDYDISFNESLVFKSNMQLEDGKKCTEDLLDSGNKFDAIFSASDYAAMGAMQVLKKKNIKIPKDVALVGFSNEPFTSLTDPALTSVNQFPVEIGRAVAELFFETLQAGNKKVDPKKIVLQPELIIRASSCKK